MINQSQFKQKIIQIEKKSLHSPKSRTSTTHPILLNPLPAYWPGTLYITFAPGKIQKDSQTGPWNRSLEQDLQRIKSYYQVSTLVCLLTKREIDQLKIPQIFQLCIKNDIKYEWYQIQQFMIPQSEDSFKQIVEKIVQESLNLGKNVVVVCKAGLGRSGTFAAACLIKAGMGANDAIKIVRTARNDSINSPIQQQWLLQKLKF